MSTGSAYALYSNGDADESHDNIIARLNANFTNVEELVYTFFGTYPLNPLRNISLTCLRG